MDMLTAGTSSLPDRVAVNFAPNTGPEFVAVVPSKTKEQMADSKTTVSFLKFNDIGFLLCYYFKRFMDRADEETNTIKWP